MDERRKRGALRRSTALGLLAGTLAGSTIFVVTSAIAQGTQVSNEAYVEATHLPPLLTTGGAVMLEYDAYCVDPAMEAPDTSCDVTGSAFVRAGGSGRFRELPLARDGATSRLGVRVPESIASSQGGFTYYAELGTGQEGTATTLPAGGASAPHRSLPLGRAIQVDLGPHTFGSSDRATERVAAAAWGDGSSEAGLEQGRNIAPIGPSTFDVDASGTVVLLDQAHGRLLRWRRGVASPTPVPLDVDGTLADMTLAPDGTVYVLESVGRGGRGPLVRRFDSNGRSQGSTEIADGRWSRIGQGPDGPIVLQQPSQQWMSVVAAGSLVGTDGQRRSGRSGRPHRGGAEIVLLRDDDEIRVALARSSGVLRSWRITSQTPFAEVQLAEPLGSRLVLVTRVYTDERDEFLVLILDRDGLRGSFSLDSADWAETAPLSRFRLVGSALFQLGSTAAGVFVDRFDLETA